MSKIDIFAEELTPSIDFNRINKTALGKVSGAVVDKVVSGDEDALEVYVKAKAIQEVASKIIGDLKGLALDEANKYDSSESKIMGCEFMVKSGSTSYIFDHDDEWNTINDKIKELTKERKEREKKMIDATQYSEIVDESGEIVPAAIIKKSNANILTITIPK